MSAPFTREDMVDAIATAISDSMDVDWNSRTGAEAVVRNCGVFEIYEALICCRGELDHALNCPARAKLDCRCSMKALGEQADAALAKVRGEQ